MYNAEIPKDVELPSSKKLLKSTAIAAVSAIVVLVTCVMPAEYAIDPTGIGKVLGLSKMGEIKQSLAEESENGIGEAQVASIPNQVKQETENLSSALPLGSSSKMPMPPIAKETISLELKPNQATEVKLSMPKDASVAFDWKSSGGGLNYNVVPLIRPLNSVL